MVVENRLLEGDVEDENGPPNDGGDTFKGGREDGNEDETVPEPDGAGMRLIQKRYVSNQLHNTQHRFGEG